jgi:hypothetical protein
MSPSRPLRMPMTRLAMAVDGRANNGANDGL